MNMPYMHPDMKTDLDEEAFQDLATDLEKARVKFPSAGNHMHTALTEEVGKLAEALMRNGNNGAGYADVRKEAIQVATMAMWIVTEGDGTFGYDPAQQGDPSVCAENAHTGETADQQGEREDDVTFGMALTQAASDVIQERRRQITDKGYTTDYDDNENWPGDLAQAGSCYARYAGDILQGNGETDAPDPLKWPFSLTCWKDKGPRRNLIRAGAFMLAEIERLDRVAEQKAASVGLGTADAHVVRDLKRDTTP